MTIHLGFPQVLEQTLKEIDKEIVVLKVVEGHNPLA